MGWRAIIIQKTICMLQDSSIVHSKHLSFVERVVELDTVWALQNEEGCAVSNSNEYDDVEVIPFWSDKAYAAACAKEDWKEYRAVSMPLAEFLEDWCVGLHNDDLLVGTNWDANMFGEEANPLALALEILEKLKEKNKAITLTKYATMDEFERLLRTAISDKE